MNIFQILGLALVGLLLALSILNAARGRSRPVVSFLWLIIWGLAGAAIYNPNLTTKAAHFLGIQRGADLVFYLAVLGGLIGFFFVYLQLRRLNRQLTLLVREIAMAGATKKKDSFLSGEEKHGTGSESR